MDEIVVINKEELKDLVSETIRSTMIELGIVDYEMRSKYYTRREVLKLWGISQSTLYRMEKLGQLKPMRLGRKRIYEKEFIDQFDISKLKHKKSA